MNAYIIAHKVCEKMDWSINRNTLNQILYVLAINYVPRGKLINEPFIATQSGPKIFCMTPSEDIICEENFPPLNLSCPEPILDFIEEGLDYVMSLDAWKLKYITQLQHGAYWKNYKNDRDIEIPYDDIVNECKYQTRQNIKYDLLGRKNHDR